MQAGFSPNMWLAAAEAGNVYNGKRDSQYWRVLSAKAGQGEHVGVLEAAAAHAHPSKRARFGCAPATGGEGVAQNVQRGGGM